MSKKTTPAVQSPAATAPALANHLVFIDHTTSVDVTTVFRGDYSPITAERFNSAADLVEAVKFQFLCDEANITPDVSEFKLSDSEKRAYDVLFKARTAFGFGATSQAAFAATMRAAQNFYATKCQRKHPISLGNLVSALAAHTVHNGKKVPSYLESQAKRFQDNVAECGSVFKPVEPAKAGGDKKTKASKVDLTPSESQLVEAASKQVKALLKCGNLTEMLAKLEEIDKLLSKVVQQHAE